MKIHLTVSEIAGIVGIAPRTIRYYAKIGLFPPSGTNPANGYHYYTIEKIEELRLIKYLRHLEVPIRDIQRHLADRDIHRYHAVLQQQLDRTLEKIQDLTFMAGRLRKRMQSIDYIRSLDAEGRITRQVFPERRVMTLRRSVQAPLDWEVAMLEFETRGNLPPSLFIGDIGFFVDLTRLDQRHPTEFTGLYLLADEPYFDQAGLLETLPGGEWLTVHFRGDHEDAPEHYRRLMRHIEANGLKTRGVALERVLLDHYLSGDPDLMVTEIQLPLL